MWRNVLARHPALGKVFSIDLHLFFETRDVGYIDLDGSIPQSLHELIVQKLSVFRLICMTNDQLIDIGLREFLRLYLVLLGGSKQVIQKRHIQLENFDKFDDASVRNIEFTIKVESPWIRIRPKQSNLFVVDIARQLCRILILLVFGLEGTDANPVFFTQDHAFHSDMINDLDQSPL